jgi:transposase
MSLFIEQNAPAETRTYLKITRSSSIGYKCPMIRLTDEQWERIRKHFPEEHIPEGRPGRKPIPSRRVLEAVLWILNTGAQWHMLPQSYPNYKTVHRRFQTWCRDDILRRLLMDIANELRDRGELDEEECFIDATFVMAKGGGAEIGPTRRGKGMKIMAIVDRHGLPLSVSTHAANHSRSAPGAAMLRLLHDRSQAGEFDW